MFRSSTNTTQHQLLFLGAAYFCFFATLGLVIPYLPPYLEYQHLKPFQIGVLLAIAIAARIVAPGIWAYWADTTGKRTQVIRLGASLALLSFSALYFSTAFMAMLIAILFFNFFWNAILAQLEVLTLSYLGDRSHHYAKIRLWGSVGFIANVTLGAWVIEEFGMPAILHLGAVTLACLALSVYCLDGQMALSTSSSHKSTKNAQQADSQSIFEKGKRLASAFVKSPLFAKALWPFWLSALLLQVSFGPYYTFFLIYMEDLGWSTHMAGALISLGVLAEIILFMYSARLLARFSIKSLLICAMLLTTLRWLALGYFPTLLPLLLMAQLLHAASFALAHAASMAFLHHYFEVQYKGRAQAVYASFGFGFGGALGAFLAGLYWQQSPSITYALAAGAALLAGILVMKLPSFTMNKNI